MKKPMLYISLTLSAALLFSACGEKEDVIRPGETMSASETAASAAAGGTLQKDGSRWSITSLADWDEFDSDGNFSDNCHAFLRAILEGESDFDGFRLLRVSEYRLTRDEKEYGLPCLYFEFTVTASNIEALPVGSHTAILTDAVDCFLKLDGAAPKNDGAFADDPAAAAVRGWIETSKVDALELAVKMTELGVKRIIFTDIATDGAFTGPSLKPTAALCRLVPDCKIIASGGVSAAEDAAKLSALKLPNLEGVIVGKALYDGRTTYRELVEAAARG